MSAESSQWLNNNVLVGFTEKRGHAWHYKASDQGTEPNHYVGPVPLDDVLRRLFHWHAVELPVYVPVPATLDDFDWVDPSGQPVKLIQRVDRKNIAADDNWADLGMFKDGYEPHQYDQWLLDSVATILDDDLSIGSAGLLRNRAVAWVSVEVPDNITTPEGVVFRPNLTAATSFDGTLATTFKRHITNIVCDNTLAAGMGESGQQFKVKHSRNSSLKIADARSALNIIYSAADDFAAEVKALCEWEVSAADWKKVLDAMAPKPDADDSKRATTMADNKRSALVGLYDHDERVTPWKNTAFGVLQCFNTYTHHVQTVRGAERAERNMLDVLSGKMANADADVISTLTKVTGRTPTPSPELVAA